MRYALINDTSATNNPGCQDTVRSLKALYARYGHRTGATIPVGAAHGHFVACAEQFQTEPLASSTDDPAVLGTNRRRCAQLASPLMKLARKALRRGRSPVPMTATDRFELAVETILRSHKAELADCDHVVINGEGTMHHDRPGAFALLGWAHAAKRLGKHVAAVNCTLESFGPPFWHLLRQSVDYLAVREPESHRYVRPHFPDVRLAADAIFHRQVAADSLAARPQNRAGYSPGVLSYEGVVTADSVRAHLKQLRGEFEEVVFFTTEVEDQAFEPVAAELGCRIEPLGAITAENAVEQMGRLSVLVSGRYHLCIFALLGGTPLVPLQSNTWKMDGLLALSGKPFPRLPLGHAEPLPELSRIAAGAGDCDRGVVLPKDFDLGRLRQRALLNVPEHFRAATAPTRPRGTARRSVVTQPLLK